MQMLSAINFLTNKLDDYTGYALMCRIVTRLWDDVKLARTLEGMYAGPDLPFSDQRNESSVESHPIIHPRSPSVDIDVSRVESICSFNAFSMDSLKDQIGLTGDSRGRTNERSNALYELPSYCNHSCLPSAHRIFFGDAMVIRAARTMKAGEEVTMPYFTEDAVHDGLNYAETLKKSWGFTCKCEVCLAKQADGPETLARREKMLESLKANPSKSQAKTILSAIENSYKKPHWDKIPVKKDLAGSYCTMATVVYSAMRSSDATQIRAGIEYLTKCIQADGIFVRLRKADHGRKASKASVKLDIKGCPSCGFHGMIPTMIQVCVFNPSVPAKKPHDYLSGRKLAPLHKRSTGPPMDQSRSYA